MSKEQNYSKGFVTSKDGTIIGYRCMGSGPGFILMHGGMGSSQSLMNLAVSLSSKFTVYIPDCRGRGLSGPFGDDYSIQKEVEDLNAILNKTNAHYLFGLSSGAFILLQAALILPTIHKIALYEPPLFFDHSLLEKINSVMHRFDQEISEGKIAAALVTVLEGLEILPPNLNNLSRVELEKIFTHSLEEDAKSVSGDDVPQQVLVPTQHFDFQLVIETDGTLEDFKAVTAEVLLIGGSESPLFLRQTIDALSKVLSNVTRVELSGLDHTGPIVKQEVVAKELLKYFK